MDFLSWFALLLLIFTVCVLAYGIVAIHDIPYNIAKKRNHPHAEAIHAGGWVSLFTLHAIWPFLWIWAYSYHPKGGYKGRPLEEAGETESAESHTSSH
jgi:prepilin signal peptidase PulO-like enzyme (type II secretory pathway)